MSTLGQRALPQDLGFPLSPSVRSTIPIALTAFHMVAGSFRLSIVFSGRWIRPRHRLPYDPGGDRGLQGRESSWGANYLTRSWILRDRHKTFFIVGVFTGTMFWLRFGLGRHEAVVLEEDPMNVQRFYQTIFANEILYPMGLACARLSLVILYNRIFGLFTARYYLYGTMAFIMAWSVYATLPLILACKPVENFWTTHKNCIDISRLYISIAVGSIVTDFMLMILPMPYAARLRMSWYKKMLLLMSFVFGGFNCFITIIRLVKVSTFDYKDPTWGTVDLMIWTGLEAYCAVICCCLPTLRPLFQYPSTGAETLVEAAPDGQELSEVPKRPRQQAPDRTLEDSFKEFDFGTTTLNDLRRYGLRADSDSYMEDAA
ncbi:Satratoxin biosynthesis SC1 cluster protein 4 [Colletotrichum orbiculare MAFF 240422]|uniref:Satratoxin biosynthesis SC1 cluster protein 4 n=1 Tax=Colletotrichum orbiculare (strain 104-T / ATCC 96160 / CBS 514.97 / LARS 414 / MAFF 240422) TaxID=1213857 RepID=A0A484FN13_COLOR|nr:Satratoxin biosynthesis SC1 cluster protein 4 [Colletotrichum orbiculare MAFF 240422]